MSTLSQGNTYNFDRIIDRTGKATYKWDQSEKLFGRQDIVPLWVADMDFEPPQQVIDAIVARAQEGIYGYTIRTERYYDAVISWMKRRHEWDVKREWITTAPGVVPALSVMVQAFTEPGDRIILQSPVYYPFYDVIRMNNREIVDNALLLHEADGRYEMNFEQLESQCAAGAKMLLLCTPHNPGGRVWTRDELERVGDICVRHNVLIVADEIHHDIVLGGRKHVPIASISEAINEQTLTCVATSKTFNLAGLQEATIVIANGSLRRKYEHQLKALSIHMASFFGENAIAAAYNYGDHWLDELIAYIEGNLAYLNEFITHNIPQIKVIQPEATYLVWLDCRAISEDPADLKKLMFEEAGVAFSEGSVFGKQGAGYLRVNLATPRANVVEALNRFAKAIQKRSDAS